MINNYVPLQNNQKPWVWKKILFWYQQQPGSLRRNDPKDSDTLRITMVKVLRAITVK